MQAPSTVGVPSTPPPPYEADHQLDEMANGRVPSWSVVAPSSRECRICLEKGGSSMFSLIAPCLCKGTSAFVHRECLDKWRAQSARAFSFCRECGFEYRLTHNISEATFTKSRYRMLVNATTPACPPASKLLQAGYF